MTNDQKQRLRVIREGIAPDYPSVYYSRDLMHQDHEHLDVAIAEARRLLADHP